MSARFCRVKFFNNQPLPPDYEDEGSRVHTILEEKEEVDYTDLISQEELTSCQPNDGSEVAQHQHKDYRRQQNKPQEIEMEDYPIQAGEPLILAEQSSVFRGHHS